MSEPARRRSSARIAEHAAQSAAQQQDMEINSQPKSRGNAAKVVDSAEFQFDPAKSSDALYESQIVTMDNDPYREASFKKRQYEEQHPETVDWKARLPKRFIEFGGPVGVTTIIVCSHFLIWFFTICLQVNSGEIIKPNDFNEFFTGQYFLRMFNLWCEISFPQLHHCLWYWGFLVVQAIFAVTLPGVHRWGEPLPSLAGKKLPYLCNAVAAFWATFTTMFFLDYYNIFPYTGVIDNICPLATVAMFTADFIAIAIYFNLFGTGESETDITHNFFYDVFMGVVLNPRLGKLDIKMFFEVRVSWIMMTLMATSAAAKFYSIHGYLSNGMIIAATGITIYSYSCMKGEHLILPSYDITTERYGALLCFWNTALPFLYSANASFILRRDPAEIAIPDVIFYAMMCILFTAFYCFDTANSQTSVFRQMYNGTHQPRNWALPQFAYGTLKNARYLRTKAGTPLLMDGWYAHTRKFHYTSDATMGLMWCLSCGFNLYFIPKFYIMFFVGMLLHRCGRDEEKCRHKYGKDWDIYCSHVKYRFIPYVY